MTTDNDKKAYLCIDVGGTFLKSAVLDEKGEIPEDSYFTLAACSEDTHDVVWEVFLEAVNHGKAVVANAGYRLGGIGIAFPGPFDYRNAISLMKHKFQSLYGINIRERLYSTSEIAHDTPIVFLHDVEAVLVGELCKGKSKSIDNAVVVTLGTGLGFSFCQKRRIQRNDLGGPAISIYNLPYKDGILEDYVSKRGIIRLYESFGGNISGNPDVDVIGEKADQGDEAAAGAFREAGRILAAALEPLLAEHSIECILFGGQISRSFHLFEKAVTEGVSHVESLLHIARVEDLDMAAMRGIWETIRMKDSTKFVL
ncbi:MAG: ROK family protein [Tannerella sp.]|jgi:glucokinase|nr:ROK family protein [Tannerella sp.]